MLEDRYEEVLQKYDFTVSNRSRVRGAILLETNKGYKIIKETRTSAGRLVWENKIKSHLKQQGFTKIDSFYLNKEGTISTSDSSGVRYVVRDWYIGSECDLRNINEIRLAAQNLGSLHVNLKGMGSIVDGSCVDTEDIVVVFKRHNSEMKHIRNYLKNRKDKNEFELALLQAYATFYNQAVKAVEVLDGPLFRKLYTETCSNRDVYHGSYTYHNVLMCPEGVTTTVFDKCAYGIQLMDLYYFLRKVMEKNEWNMEYGRAILEGYESVKKLTEDEKEVLKLLLLYPEKFWKLASYYMNGKKTWISHKNMEKLNALCAQLENRDKFINEIV